MDSLVSTEVQIDRFGTSGIREPRNRVCCPSRPGCMSCRSTGAGRFRTFVVPKESRFGKSPKSPYPSIGDMPSGGVPSGCGSSRERYRSCHAGPSRRTLRTASRPGDDETPWQGVNLGTAVLCPQVDLSVNTALYVVSELPELCSAPEQEPFVHERGDFGFPAGECGGVESTDLFTVRDVAGVPEFLIQHRWIEVDP